jgi:hypothetical protein
MRKLVLVLAALLGLVTLLPARRAEAQGHRNVVVAQLDTFAVVKGRDGFRADPAPAGRDAVIGMLRGGGSVLLEIRLQAGKQYFIGAGCDGDCSDLDLRALSSDGQTVLAEDVADDDVPIVTFTARTTGPHFLAVMMPECSTDLCYFGFKVMSK